MFRDNVLASNANGTSHRSAPLASFSPGGIDLHSANAAELRPSGTVPRRKTPGSTAAGRGIAARRLRGHGTVIRGEGAVAERAAGVAQVAQRCAECDLGAVELKEKATGL